MKNIKGYTEFINEGKSFKMKFNEEGKCPICYSNKLKYKGGSAMNNSNDYKDYTCKSCGFEGTEVYEFDRLDNPVFDRHSTRIKDQEMEDFPDF